jgi:predicted Rossmann fold nucleotide-binding protein DprA/Smf involved in DNA uptake
MKTIIAGSRDITDYALVVRAVVESKFCITEVVSGTASGVDKLGERYALEKGIAIKSFPAAWDDLTAPKAIIRIRKDGKRYNRA